MKTINIVLHFKLLKSIEIGNFRVVFLLRLRQLLGKSKNVLNKVPSRYNSLPENNACRGHPSTSASTRKLFTDKKEIIIYII